MDNFSWRNDSGHRDIKDQNSQFEKHYRLPLAKNVEESMFEILPESEMILLTDENLIHVYS